ncbi:hypothetical protein BS47DRAFT_1387249 [Hydnum rufescens UP504]|uniref:Cytochrome P450 n=1 Tax=Hydnum rufescens UP504 TaxID=1448309 RepID=A0A9P6DZK8_9AGAM|nr:hypothetical protein BS47DRAFT_1387249 [Hydnum rufescens UP504]
MRNARAARRLGAVQYPIVEGRWPGSVDLLINMMRRLEGEYTTDYMAELAEEYGPTYIIRILWDDEVITIEPRHIKQILVNNFPNYIKGEEFNIATRAVLGSGVFNADNQVWKFHRAMARPFFTRERITDFDIFARHADKIIQKMKDNFSAGNPIDIQDAMGRFTLDSAAEFLFGAALDSISESFILANDKPPTQAKDRSMHFTSSAFIRAVRDTQQLIARRLWLGPIWMITEMFGDNSTMPMKDINKFLGPILEDALSRNQDVTEAPNEIGSDTTFLEHMISQTKDRVVLRDSIMNMLTAGREPITCTIAFLTYMLSQHPKVLGRLREEILHVVGPLKVPQYDDIRSLRYLRAVINETLRLFPPVPMNLRCTVNEDVWTDADGKRYYIPPNITVGYIVLLMHRDRGYWGEDALEFDPDRWFDPRMQKVLKEPFIFLPFNAGHESAWVNRFFAYNEISFMIIRLLQSFSSIELRPEAQPKGTLPPSDWPVRDRNQVEKIWPRSHVTLYSEGGLWLTMDEAALGGEL